MTSAQAGGRHTPGRKGARRFDTRRHGVAVAALGRRDARCTGAWHVAFNRDPWTRRQKKKRGCRRPRRSAAALVDPAPHVDPAPYVSSTAPDPATPQRPAARFREPRYWQPTQEPCCHMMAPPPRPTKQSQLQDTPL